jgi:flagellar protein FlbD
MIKLTRLGGEEFVLNADLIRYVESRPDTFITLTHGDRVVVQEAMDEVLRRAIEYQRAKHLIPSTPATGSDSCSSQRGRPRSTTTTGESLSRHEQAIE